MPSKKAQSAILNVGAWLKCGPRELSAYLASKSSGPPRRKPKRGQMLVVRAQLKPIDVYAYLRARFGTPNGIQNLLRADDSDNLFHWDFLLKSEEAHVYISGTSREIHFHLSEALSDQQWCDLVKSIKADFARTAAAKSAMARTFEKFLVFENKFVSLADYCADLHAKIVDAPPFEPFFPSAHTKRGLRASMGARKKAFARARSVNQDSVTLSLLTPIMAEAFINLLILTLRTGALANDATAYAEFVRAKIPDKLGMLHVNCVGFRAPVDIRTEAYRSFLRVMNKRNFAIHGNLDPEREHMEVVYFEGKRPLFAETGDHQMQFFEKLEQLYRPNQVIRDYEDVHAFLHEITTYLVSEVEDFIRQVAETSFPGYEVKKKKVTRILPENIVISFFQGQRYDDELKVDW